MNAGKVHGINNWHLVRPSLVADETQVWFKVSEALLGKGWECHHMTWQCGPEFSCNFPEESKTPLNLFCMGSQPCSNHCQDSHMGTSSMHFFISRGVLTRPGKRGGGSGGSWHGPMMLRGPTNCNPGLSCFCDSSFLCKFNPLRAFNYTPPPPISEMVSTWICSPHCGRG